jgi:prolyl oligopeptidase
LRLRLILPLFALVCGCSEPDVHVGAPPHTPIALAPDTFHGQVVEDPYRWLEDQESPETRAWIDVQNAYADVVFAQLPGRERLAALMTSLMQIDEADIPTEKGGRYFFSMRRADDDLSVLYYRDGYAGTDHVIVDPHGMSEDHTTSVGFRDVSDNGKLVAYAIREGGADQVSLHIRDVDAGTDLPDVLPTRRYTPIVQLAPDNAGLFYSIYGNENPRLYYHAFGSDVSEDTELFGEDLEMADMPFGFLSHDGRWMLMIVRHGAGGWTQLHLKDLQADGNWVEVINDGKSHTWGRFAGNKLLLTTDLDADNYRVMTADLTRPHVEYWTEFLPEREDIVVESASAVGGYYFVSYMQDAQPRLAQYDTAGNHVRQIEFETLGSPYGPYGEWVQNEAFVTFTSFHVPATIYRLDVHSGERTLWFRPEIPIDIDGIEVEQVWYESKDGTPIPMFVGRRRDLELNGDNPTLLTGYGGFGIVRRPTFWPEQAAWLDMGGVVAVASLRGGGEFGEEWHEAGRLSNKQNVFDDFIAAAEYLTEQGYTRPDRLGITGSSNGGLLVGAAMTQRPDLFGAVVCQIPLLDMLRYDRFLVAPFWIAEYGSATDPGQFEYLRAYSPYHNVVAGISYPATLFRTGDLDTRVDPLHARKMTALVQAANAGENPILLRYRTEAGHSGGLPLSKQVEDAVDLVSFLRWRLARE